MPFDRAGRALVLAAAIATAVPAPAGAAGRVIWLELCDALHPGRKVPIPLDRDEPGPGQSCHAASCVLPDRRLRR